MKNYKAEITKIISKSPAVMSEDYNLIDEMAVKILSLIREIVNEAVKPMDYAENVLDKNVHHLEISLYNQRKDGYNQACSEILSNVEEMIK